MEVIKLKNISIENYRFFRDKQLFDFTKDDNPQNILLYGENGSGKTSLYNAMIDFFFYYKNPTESKKRLIDNKNIFSETENKPSIEITFDNDTKIKFDNDTKIKFDKDGYETDLKEAIERVSKSKLFLTYQDIYNLNNIFKKDLSYKEFKDIFTILYFDELDENFDIFDTNFEELKDTVLNYTHDMKEDYEYLEKIINDFGEEFTYELEPLLKKDPDDKHKHLDFIYDTVFYISEDYIDKLKEIKKQLDTFFDICSNDKAFRADYYDLQTRFLEIIENIRNYTRKYDRYEADELSEKIIIIDKEDIESISAIDSLINDIDTATYDTSLRFIECKKQSEYISETILAKLQESKDRINEILSFLNIEIRIEEVEDRPFLYFDTDYIFTEYIRNIDFKILLSGKELKNHWSNLNEAKLSALNFAIYLSSVLQKKPDIPLLVLDDLLISLDMSNRDKIVELLLDRTKNTDDKYNYFDDEYQMFIFTHDRAFFEMAKYKMDFIDKENWNYHELYVDYKDTKEKPYLKIHQSYHEKAVEYFEKREYEVASNFLRKEVEKQLHEYLGLKTLEGSIETAKIKDNYKKLEDCFAPLIIVLKGFDKCEDIPVDKKEERCVAFAQKVKEALFALENIFKEDSFHDINGIKDRILNPQSHYDSSKPLYKKELEDAIKLIESLVE